MGMNRVIALLGVSLWAIVQIASPSHARGELLHSFQSNYPSGDFGLSIANAGDVDGDGKDDVIVAEPRWKPTGVPWDYGSAHLFSGGSGALIRRHYATISSTSFGSNVAGLGDLNGDGYDDYAISAPGDTTDGDRGRVFVYSGVNGALLYMLRSFETLQSSFGLSMTAIPDQNGDGINEIIISAPRFRESFERTDTNTGKIYKFSGMNGQLLAERVGPTYIGPNPDITAGASYFGYSVASTDDHNGDGIADIVVGAPAANNGNDINVGKIYILDGVNLTTITAFFGILSTGNLSDGNLNYGDTAGSTVRSADVNGDGREDIIAAASSGIYVFNGFTGQLHYQASIGVSVERPLASLGTDLNGDGFPDFAVGNFSSNRATIISGPNGEAGEQIEGADGTAFGFDVDVLGDINGDEQDDLVISVLGDTAYGRVEIHSTSDTTLGSTHILERQWTGSIDDLWLGMSSEEIGDINGDGWNDFIIGGRGRLSVSSGQNPDVTFYTRTHSSYSFGLLTRRLGDFNGDSRKDFAVTINDPGNRAVRIYSGATGNTMYTYWDFAHPGSVSFGNDVAGLNENRIAISDFLHPMQSGPSGHGGGKIWIYNGLGSLVCVRHGPRVTNSGSPAPGRFGHKLANIGDVNGDGFDDLAVSDSLPYSTSNGMTRSTYVISGNNCDVLYQLDMADPEVENFGSSLSALGDVSGDGVPDFIVGAPDSGGLHGHFYIVSGADGVILHQHQSLAAGGKFGSQISGGKDVNGDSIPDFIVSAPIERDATFTWKGANYLFSGDGTLLKKMRGAGEFGTSVALMSQNSPHEGKPRYLSGSRLAGANGRGASQLFSLIGFDSVTLAPEAIGATSRFADKIIVGWSHVPGAHYKLYRSLVPSACRGRPFVITPLLRITDRNLPAGSQYWYSVRAIGENGPSACRGPVLGKTNP